MSTDREIPEILDVAAAWAWRVVVVAAAIASIAWAAAYLSLIVVPIVIALVVSSLLEPVRRLLVRSGARPRVAWAAAFLFGVISVTTMGALAITEFSVNYDTLSDQAVQGATQATDWLANGPFQVKVGGLNESLDEALSAVKRDPGNAITGTVSVLSTTGTLLAAGLLTLISTLFFMKDRSSIWRWIVALFPGSLTTRVDVAGHAAWEVLISYNKVTLTSAVVDSVVIGVACVVAGVPVAFSLAVLVFLFAFVPMIGALFSGSIVVLVALVAQGPTTAFVLLIVVVVVQLLDANLMYPMLANRHLAIHPLATLLLVAGGGIVAGLFGAFIAVPLAAMLMAALSSVRDDESPEQVIAAS